MHEQNKALVRRYFNEVLNKGKYELIKVLFSPSFLFSGPRMKRPIQGLPEGLYDFVANARHAFPDLYVSIENEIAEDDQVAVVWRMTGTHEHAFHNIKPTHKHKSITGIDIFTIDRGRIEGMWAFFDMVTLVEHKPKNIRSRTKTRKKPLRKTSAQKK